ncbi:hypothetical protein [Pseudomonas sp. 22 E 5]|nr:hypothetical protein [Pseudomonas sp. 22 E 5]
MGLPIEIVIAWHHESAFSGLRSQKVHQGTKELLFKLLILTRSSGVTDIAC